ncbi:MAG: wax ester/triacylglycerol synthase family O-acyltransferase [Caldilineaceae bacterium]
MAKSTQREPMGRVDKAWLEMDHETNQMIINGVMLFDAPLTYAAVQDVFAQRMVEQFPRFRQRVVEAPPGSNRFFWEDDPFFDIRAHLLHIALPAPGDIATLQQLVGTLMSTSLDRSKPVWVVYLIDNVDGASALFARFHHAIADGIALIQVMLSMTDTDPDAALLPVLDVPDVAPRNGTGGGLVGSGVRLVRRTVRGAAGLTGTAVRGGLHVVRDPKDALDVARGAGIVSAASAAVLARLLLIPPDRPSVYRGELGIAKRRLVGVRVVGPGQSHRTGHGRHGQRRVDRRAHRGAACGHAGTGRRSPRRRLARHGPGQPAQGRRTVDVGQPVRAGLPLLAGQF